MSDAPRIRMVRRIDAPRERVFRAWTTAEELRRWWGPDLFSTTDADVDLRVGGRYRFVMVPDGGEPMALVGEYREVVPPERLVYTWRWESGWDGGESVVTVTFADAGDATDVVLVHDRFPQGSPADPYVIGWEQGLDKLAAVVGAGGA